MPPKYANYFITANKDINADFCGLLLDYCGVGTQVVTLNALLHSESFCSKEITEAPSRAASWCSSSGLGKSFEKRIEVGVLGVFFCVCLLWVCFCAFFFVLVCLLVCFIRHVFPFTCCPTISALFLFPSSSPLSYFLSYLSSLLSSLSCLHFLLAAPPPPRTAVWLPKDWSGVGM